MMFFPQSCTEETQVHSLRDFVRDPNPLKSFDLLLTNSTIMSIKLVTLLSIVVAAHAATTNTNLQTTFPKSSGTTVAAAVKTIAAGASFDGGMYQYDRSPSTCNEQAEGGDSDAVFLLQNGATLSNVIIGPNNGEGVHCLGTCTLNNV